MLVMGFTFLILNPTILLPETWREMLKFSSENRIGHDSYEFWGSLYTNKMSAWLNGVPWTFYYVFMAVKTSLPILVLFLIGLPLVVRRKLGDGRFLLFFWAFMWFLPFTFLGGKFTRYFTFVEPLMMIVAAVGFYYSVKWLTEKAFGNTQLAGFVQALLLVGVVATQFTNSMTAAPHFRLFTNSIGGGAAAAGTYFPHDEFYDAASLEIVKTIAATARPNAMIACETPTLFAHYAAKTGRTDLSFVSLSDKTKVLALSPDDFVVLAEGRRYLSNTPYIIFLNSSSAQPVEILLSGIRAARIYKLDAAQTASLHVLARQ
jgi:hypothetical protein